MVGALDDDPVCLCLAKKCSMPRDGTEGFFVSLFSFLFFAGLAIIDAFWAIPNHARRPGQLILYIVTPGQIRNVVRRCCGFVGGGARVLGADWLFAYTITREGSRRIDDATRQLLFSAECLYRGYTLESLAFSLQLSLTGGFPRGCQMRRDGWQKNADIQIIWSSSSIHSDRSHSPS